MVKDSARMMTETTFKPRLNLATELCAAFLR